MKKNLFIAAMGLLVLAGCSSNEDEINNIIANNDNAISFDTYVGKTTKGSVTDDAAIKMQNAGFYVLASYTKTDDWETAKTSAKPDFMYNQNVTYNTNKWEYSPVKYWPNEQDGTTLGKVTFFAYAPKADGSIIALSNATTTGAPVITLTVPDVIADQKDLVTSMAKDKVKTDNQVSFIFGHILSKINFLAVIDKAYTNTSVKITEFKVTPEATAIKNNGTYNLDGAAWALGSTYHEAITGTPNLENDLSTTPTDLVGNMFMLPQQAGKITASITYTVTTTDDVNSANTSIVTNKKDLVLTTISGGWLPNKQYTYTFSVSLTDVTVDASVTGWDNSVVAN